ncbi:unnamed protein product, partial [Rotaria sordida]
SDQYQVTSAPCLTPTNITSDDNDDDDDDDGFRFRDFFDDDCFLYDLLRRCDRDGNYRR